MDKNLPVGVIDSGVGGLSVLKVLQQALPHEDFLYIGDTGIILTMRALSFWLWPATPLPFWERKASETVMRLMLSA